jgi:hypothetical protein
MKNKIIPIILFALLIPNLAFASWWNPFSWFRKNVVEENKNNVATTTRETKNVGTSSNPTSVTRKIAPMSIKKAPVLEKVATSSCNQSCIDKLVNEKYKQEEAQRLQAKVVEDEKVRQSQDEIRRLSKLRQQEARDKRTANKVTLPPTTSDNPPATTQTTYSDYNFDYKWENNVLSCPMTPRNIVIKKAVFKLPESELEKINALRALESDGFKLQILDPRLQEIEGLNPVYNSTFNLEKRDNSTYVYFGGNIRACGDGVKLSLNYQGVLSDVTTDARNITAYLSQKSISVEVSNGSGGDPRIVPGTSDTYFSIPMAPVMSEWEVFDNTTNKPVKI